MIVSTLQTYHPCNAFCPDIMGATQGGALSVLNAILLFSECHVLELDFRLIATVGLTLPPSKAVILAGLLQDTNTAVTWSVQIILSNSLQ
jgi:hypothetical protein